MADKKEDLMIPGTPQDPPKTDPNEERIKKLEELVSNLSKDNSSLREETAKLQEGWSEYTSPVSANKTATLKVYRENATAAPGLIVKLITFKNNAFNEETRKNDKLIYLATMRYDDGKTKDVQIDALTLSEINEVEQVELIKEDRRTLRKIDGYVPRPSTDKEGFPKRMLGGGSGYGSSIGSGEVPLEVFAVKSEVTVKRKNGQEFTMSSDYLNM